MDEHLGRPARQLPLAQVRRDGEEHHAGVAHAERAHQQVEVGVDEEPDGRRRHPDAQERHQQHALERESFEEIRVAVHGGRFGYGSRRKRISCRRR